MLSLFASNLISTIILFSLGNIFQKIFLKDDLNKLSLFESGIFGFIFLSFIALIINFILPLNKFVGDILFFFLIIYFFKIYIKFSNKKELNKLLFFVTIISFILIYGSNINRPDAGLYHLPYISILQENKIILGITNLHHRFGHTSIVQYISAIYNSHFLNIEFINIPLASLFAFYFYYLINYFLLNKDLNINKNIFSFFIILFSFYAFGRYSNYGNDGPAHLYFFMIIFCLINIKKFHINELFKITLFSIFCFANKASMVITLIIPIYLFIQSIKNQNLKKLIINRKIIVCVFFLSLLNVKNILISGCLIYPISKTCINSLKFTDIEKTKKIAIEAEAWSKEIQNDQLLKIPREEYIKNFKWFNGWKKYHFKKIVEKISPLVFFLLIFLILIIITSRTIPKVLKSNKSNNLIFIISMLLTAIWFIKFPLYRFGMSFLAVLFISLFCILIDQFKINKKENFLKKVGIYFIIFALTGLIFKNFKRIYEIKNKEYVNYPWPKIYTLSDLAPNKPKKLKPIYDNKKNIIYYYSSGECMFNQSPCSNYLIQNLKIENKNGYKLIYIN